MKQQKLEKLRLLNLIIHFNSKCKDMSIMKLDKLIYLYDQELFKKSGHHATGLVYSTEKNGPAPKLLNTAILTNDSDYFLNKISFEVEANSDYKSSLKIVSEDSFDDLPFSDVQVELLNEITSRFINFNAEELSNITHLDGTPYTLTLAQKGLDAPIDLSLSLGDSERDKLLKEFIKEELGYSL